MPAFAVLYRLPPSGFIEGHVSDFNDNLPLTGATVDVKQGGSLVRQLTTDAAGFYRTQVPVGDYDVEASAANYLTQTKPAHLLDDGDVTTLDFSLETARAEVTPSALEVIVPAGQTRTRTLVVKNTGSVSMTWQVEESGGGAQAALAPGAKTPGLDSGVAAFQDVPWLSEGPDNGTLAPGGTQNVVVTINATGHSPGVYNATLFLQTNSGRNPSLRVPVKLIVPAYEQGVNAGSGPAYIDKLGDTWAADKAYASGSWGYVQRVNTASTKSAIGGTADPTLYRTARRGQTEYRFDGLPTGAYQVSLRFAEIQNYKTGQRLFDVIIEKSLVLPALDISGEVGKNYADDKTFFIPVTDGQLNVRFIQRQATKEPIVNAIRVVQRPDR